MNIEVRNNAVNTGRNSAAEEVGGKVYLHMAIKGMQVGPALPLAHNIHFVAGVLDKFTVEGKTMLVCLALRQFYFSLVDEDGIYFGHP